MSLSAMIFGRNSLIFKVGNVLGLGIPGLLDKKFGIHPPEAALGDIANQTASEGNPRPIVWGRVRPIGGNIIHCSIPVVVKHKQKSGKGLGAAPTGDTQTIYRTYALRVTEGPVTGVIRAWRNNKLVYDARGTAWGALNNGVYLNSARIYLGGYTQMPSADLEAIWGVGQVSAYRGTCYIVMVAEDLTDTGGAVPQWLFEVERSEFVPLTSKLYPLEMEIEGFSSGMAMRGADLKRLLIQEDPESFSTAMGFVSADSHETHHLDTIPTEQISSAMSFVSADERIVLHGTTMVTEQISSGMAFVSADEKVALHTYNMLPVEQISGVMGFISANLGP